MENHIWDEKELGIRFKERLCSSIKTVPRDLRLYQFKKEVVNLILLQKYERNTGGWLQMDKPIGYQYDQSSSMPSNNPKGENGDHY
ncbi:hypothetical protein DFA_01627 [Cavenderia fasciculata]|uniref:Uncharacterized protein n=1 Tax=Cavenderia fasciculata TaxID=261658 RepID=F4PTX3_CACFS|nr:uncharacterized protein DFA_01627 [Cavenderia fasciculata]EGG21741.1 hypothetical protein DFA_01627 [Cavenderia fasciculata]|eukprot:XP_004359591.1 hypothetical protein DFA_01627 [Cavenderia fasciculata]